MDYNSNGGSDHGNEGRREYGSNDSRPYRSHSDNSERPYRRASGDRPAGKSFGDRPSGERRAFGDRKPGFGARKPFGERKSYGDRPSGRAFGDKPYGERKSFGDRPYGERKPFHSQEGEGTEERRSFGDRPAGERRPFGDRKPGFGARKPFGERKPSGDRPAGRSFGDRPYGERKSYGDKPYGDRKPFHSQEGEGTEERRSFGDRPAGERKPFGERRSGFHKSGFAGKGGFGGGKGGSKRPRIGKPEFRSEDESGISRMIDRRKEFENERMSDNDNVSIPFKEEVRLNKFIANSGICSRREADNFILAGCVTVNGNVVTELGSKINVTTDDVRFNGERLHGEAKVYIVMNKPKGFVTTTSDPHAEKTVMELLRKCTARVFPVGRLDKNTTGVLMFTNDGEIAERLTHPSYDKKKIYQVSLDKDLTQEDYDKILSGVTLSDGDVAADALDYIEDNDKRKVGIEIHSGKNRVVRRIFESLGYSVKALDRVYFAGLTKKSLKRGEWRYLTEGEVNILKMGAYI